MNTETFEKLYEGLSQESRSMLVDKAREYARQEDRLHNFKRAGEMMRCTPERALIGFMAKHIVSMLDIADDIDQGHVISMGVSHEKILDGINYLYLLWALLNERSGKQ